MVAFLPERETHTKLDMPGSNMPNLLRQIARQARILEDRVMQGQALRSYERVAELFRWMIEASEPTAALEGGLSVPMDRPLFAKLTGMTPETFSRAMTRLQDAGLAVCAQGRVKFPHPDLLCRLTSEGFG